jgi:hypothetical protein
MLLRKSVDLRSGGEPEFPVDLFKEGLQRSIERTTDKIIDTCRNMDDRVKEYPDGACANSPWDLQRIVSELRTLRHSWRQNTKPDGVTYELPSQEVLSDIVDELSAALFPRHFGPPSLPQPLGLSRGCAGDSRCCRRRSAPSSRSIWSLSNPCGERCNISLHQAGRALPRTSSAP